MKGSPERQSLEEELREERGESTKIQALRDYARLKDVEYQTAQRSVDTDEYDNVQLIIKEAMIELHIQQRAFRVDAYEYREAFDSAEAILKPYVATDNPSVNPYRVFLDDLREINMEKSRK
jgi:hypothetical protein